MRKERRSSARSSTGLGAICRREGKQWPARLDNVSRQGCCVDLPRKVLARGDRMLLELNEQLVLPATVKWTRFRRAGVEFANPLHGAVLCEFVRRSSSED